MAYWAPGTNLLGRIAGWCVDHARIVLAGWVLIAGVLNVAVPQLESVVGRDATPFLPAGTPSIAAYRQMDAGFGSGKAEAPAFVVVTAQEKVDEAFYRTIVQRLRTPNSHVAEIQDYVRSPQLREALVSDDGKATYIPVALRHPVGSPEADKDVKWLRDVTTDGAPPGTRAYVTGDSAVVADLDTELTNNIARITVVSVVLILLILFFLYRNWFTPLIPLATMGVSLLVARGTVAFAGEHLFRVSTYTGAFLTALVLGAATDYTIFLIARYHEAFRFGSSPRDGAVIATERTAAVIMASAATVIIGSACLVTAKLALFHTTGPAIAIAVFTTLLVSMTFAPALIKLAGTRINPGPVTVRSLVRWKRVGDLVARHPAPLALAGLLFLGALAALYPTMNRTYDSRDLVPTGAESGTGYHAIDGHFPSYELRPDYLLITADHDLRNTRDLSVIDGVSEAIGKVPGVQTVRSATRPLGEPIPQAQLPYDVAAVGTRLDRAGTEVQDGSKQTDRLASGADQLASGAQRLSSGASQATSAVDRFLAGLQQEATGLDSAVDGTGAAQAGATQLRDGARALSAALLDMRNQSGDAVAGLGHIYVALSADPLCTVDPICRQSREALHDIYVGERDRLLPGLDTARKAADAIADGNGRLADGLAELRVGLAQAQAGIDQLAAGERRFQQKLGEIAGGADRLAGGAAQIPAGVSQIQTATDKLVAGLDQAAGFLSDTAKDARAAGLDTFYLPPGALDDPRFALSTSYYIAKDGRTARLLIFGDDNEHRPGNEQDNTRQALRGTPLEGAQVHMTGPLAVTHDIHSLADADFRLVTIVVLIAVLMILLILLRSIIAPVYLLCTVVLSYAAAIGVTTLLWNHILGKPMDWTVPLLSFIVLVAVGADYNILLMTRVREESPEASRRGVSRAVAATGGVITSAGLIFAGTFVAMATAPMLGLGETGTAIAVGLLLDTFIVRSMLVPSIAAMLGPWNWWPSQRALRRG